MTTSKKSLRQLDQRDLSRVRGGMLLETRCPLP